jgi:high-affinity nickel-transport protein
LVGKLNDNFGLLGYGIIGLFAISWIISIGIYRWLGFDHVELSAEAGEQEPIALPR